MIRPCIYGHIFPDRCRGNDPREGCRECLPDGRSRTCHPDDLPPLHLCQKKYAVTECWTEAKSGQNSNPWRPLDELEFDGRKIEVINKHYRIGWIYCNPEWACEAKACDYIGWREVEKERRIAGGDLDLGRASIAFKNLPFETALAKCKAGHRIRRDHWKGDKWVELYSPQVEMPHLAMFFDDGRIAPWTPTRCDLLEKDWSYAANFIENKVGPSEDKAHYGITH